MAIVLDDASNVFLEAFFPFFAYYSFPLFYCKYKMNI